MKSIYYKTFDDTHKIATVDVADIDEKTSLITRVFVPEEKRATGIGTELLEKATSDADKECRILLIEPRPYSDISEKAETKLIAFYKKFGFEEQKEDYMIRKPKCYKQ